MPGFPDILKLTTSALFFQFEQFDVDVVFAGGLIDPKIERIDRKRNSVKLVADKCKIFDFIISDFAVTGDLNQSSHQRLNFVQACDGFQDNA